MIDVIRSGEPASLAAKQSPWGDDVIDALHLDFLGKCYLCETKIVPGTFTVDHRRQRNHSPELEHSWHNLFPACNLHNCNGRREQSYPVGGLIDPAANGDVESRVQQQLSDPTMVLGNTEATFLFAATCAADSEAVNTARELDRIHNGTGSYKPAQRTAKALRSTILRHVGWIAEELRTLERLPTASPERDERLKNLRKLFARDAPYFMLVRSCFATLPAAQSFLDECLSA